MQIDVAVKVISCGSAAGLERLHMLLDAACPDSTPSSISLVVAVVVVVVVVAVVAAVVVVAVVVAVAVVAVVVVAVVVVAVVVVAVVAVVAVVVVDVVVVAEDDDALAAAGDNFAEPVGLSSLGPPAGRKWTSQPDQVPSY